MTQVEAETKNLLGVLFPLVVTIPEAASKLSLVENSFSQGLKLLAVGAIEVIRTLALVYQISNSEPVTGVLFYTFLGGLNRILLPTLFSKTVPT